MLGLQGAVPPLALLCSGVTCQALFSKRLPGLLQPDSLLLLQISVLRLTMRRAVPGPGSGRPVRGAQAGGCAPWHLLGGAGLRGAAL